MDIFCTWDHHPQAYAVDAFFRDMGQDVCLHFPTNLSGSQSLGAYEEGTVSALSHSATVVETALISRVITNLHCQSHSSSCSNRSAESTKDNNKPSKSQGFQSECMAVINQQFTEKGFSQKVSKLLSASWQSLSGTQRDYSGKFRQFSRWCHQKQIDIYSASLTDCAEFLTHLFNKGLKYRTIAGYGSMLSSVLQPINSIPVGQHPYIIGLLKGIFNSRPPVVNLQPEWQLPLVLKLIQRPPFEPLECSS